MEPSFVNKKVNVGRNIRLWRNIRGKSQQDLADFLKSKGNRAWTQQDVSSLEHSEDVKDDEVLGHLAELLSVDLEILKTVDTESDVNFISNSITHNQFVGYTVNHGPVFNSPDKLVEKSQIEISELRAENLRLRKENEELKKKI